MTKRLTAGRRPILHLPKNPAPPLAQVPEIDTHGRTRLGRTMRGLAKRVENPEKAILLIRYADTLDLTIFSLGRQSGFESLQAYVTARRFYEETAGVRYAPQK